LFGFVLHLQQSAQTASRNCSRPLADAIALATDAKPAVLLAFVDSRLAVNSQQHLNSKCFHPDAVSSPLKSEKTNSTI